MIIFYILFYTINYIETHSNGMLISINLLTYLININRFFLNINRHSDHTISVKLNTTNNSKLNIDCNPYFPFKLDFICTMGESGGTQLPEADAIPW